MSVDELLKVPEGEPIIEIEVDIIYAFENHPFRVLDDDKMRELEESVLNNGNTLFKTGSIAKSVLMHTNITIHKK
ncbi:MAG: ParB/RepB/Spo0J family partition protein [Neobacillus sp.]|nr:ParB/RepB/Spo0J family partition protein [Neobacillus sp.]